MYRKVGISNKGVVLGWDVRLWSCEDSTGGVDLASFFFQVTRKFDCIRKRYYFNIPTNAYYGFILF